MDLSEEESSFTHVASQCLSVLVLGVNTRLDAALTDMQRIRWDMLEQPGDYSAFVEAARKVSCGPALLPWQHCTLRRPQALPLCSTCVCHE